MTATFSSVTHGLVVFAKDKKRVSAFHQRTLGLEAVEVELSHDLLQGSGVELVIHAIPSKVAAEITITEPPQIRGNAVFKPAFSVTDLDAMRAAAEQTGGSLKPDKSAWQIRGATVLDGSDPEGNVVQFKQEDG